MPIVLRVTLFILAVFFCSQRAVAATTIPFEYRDGLIWLKVQVAERDETLFFLLDSGAGGSVLDLAVARRIGAVLGRGEDVQGVYGRQKAYRVNGFAAKASGVSVPSSLLAVDLRDASISCCRRIDGLLGLDFFRGRIVEIDFQKRAIRLLERSELYEAGCATLPLKFRNDALCAQVSVNGCPREWLRLDTGCNSGLEWIVTDENAERLGIRTVGVNSRSADELRTNVVLGSQRLKDVKTGVHFKPIFAGEGGLIGNGILSRFVVTIDMGKRQSLLRNGQ